MEMRDRGTSFVTGLGWCAVRWRGPRVIGLTFGRSSPRGVRADLSRATAFGGRGVDWMDPDELDDDERMLVSRVEAFADGAPDDFRDVVVDDEDRTPFERRVIRACRAIAYGRTATYGDLARRAGAPRAARAVGNVMRKNNVPLIVPCHRVLASGGGLGGYSAPQGTSMKERLLRMERCGAGETVGS